MYRRHCPIVGGRCPCAQGYDLFLPGYLTDRHTQQTAFYPLYY